MVVMLESKFMGSMIGSAIGDSLGKPVEGSRKPQIQEDGFSGRWTDDTHMMIGVAESLLANEGFNGNHMADRFVKRYRDQPWRGYGPGPPKVFSWIQKGISWKEASRRLYGGSGSYGNGAAMRVAPVGLLHNDKPGKLRETARAQAQITHAHELGKEGAAIQAYAVALAVNADPSMDLDREDYISKLERFTDNTTYISKIRTIRALIPGADRSKVVDELGNGFEAHNSVPAAIYSFLNRPDSYRECVKGAIGLGGDTDTIGAMSGAINGAYNGIEELPVEWRMKLESGEHIEKLAKDLCRLKVDR